MEKVQREAVLENLIKHNYPFVIFREPGDSVKFIIQNGPIEYNSDLRISEEGFYVFPFSGREHSHPFKLRPDILLDWKERIILDLELEILPISDSHSQVINPISFDNYESDIQKFLKSIDSGPLRKAIYARVKLEHLPKEFSLSEFYKNVEEQYPKAFCYLLNIPGEGLWIGASPELLLSYKNQIAQTVALAGTIKNDRQFSAPNWSRKEIDEHRLVELHIIDVLKEAGIVYEKSNVRTTNTGAVFHLKSNFKMAVAPGKISDFLNRLHPTPAISGLPQDGALDLIYEHENFDRAYYCGYLGYVHDKEDFNVYINLRCMKIWEDNIAFFAGGGITTDSSPLKEWEETELKMSTLAELLKSDLSPSVN